MMFRHQMDVLRAAAFRFVAAREKIMGPAILCKPVLQDFSTEDKIITP
ncbi:hypothetical protein [uncultured Mailhella sp.]|nr:hypothetical protein [uncultured Mailhella sp.]